jgi:hypothetical protein
MLLLATILIRAKPHRSFKANKVLTMPAINQQSIKRRFKLRVMVGRPVDTSEDRPKRKRGGEEEEGTATTKAPRLKYRQFEVIHWSGGKVSALGKRGHPNKEVADKKVDECLRRPCLQFTRTDEIMANPAVSSPTVAFLPTKVLPTKVEVIKDEVEDSDDIHVNGAIDLSPYKAPPLASMDVCTALFAELAIEALHDIRQFYGLDEGSAADCLNDSDLRDDYLLLLSDIADQFRKGASFKYLVGADVSKLFFSARLFQKISRRKDDHAVLHVCNGLLGCFTKAPPSE